MDSKVLLVISCIITASTGITITNHPQDTAVCINQLVNCACGFVGADPNLLVPDWWIAKRNQTGVVVSNEVISGEDIIRNTTDGLEWIPDLTNANNSVLRVGPVDETDNQSSYQCTFTIMSSIIFSSVGTLTVLDSPSITNIIVEEIGTTFVTISWNSTSVGVTYTITYSTGDVMMSSITNDTNYTINGLTSGTSYRISVVPSDGVCQGEEKEVMVDTNDASISICATTVLPSSKTIILGATMTSTIKDDNCQSDDDGNTDLIIIFTIIIVLLTISLVIAVVIIIWLCVKRHCKLKHSNAENNNPLSQPQLNTDTIKMQSSPVYDPINNSNCSAVPEYETIQASSVHQDVPMVDNPAYLAHNIKTSVSEVIVYSNIT